MGNADGKTRCGCCEPAPAPGGMATMHPALTAEEDAGASADKKIEVEGALQPEFSPRPVAEELGTSPLQSPSVKQSEDALTSEQAVQDNPATVSMSYPDGSTYTGEMSSEKRHGYGVYVLPTKTYKGEWVNDLRHGNGMQIWKDGRVYEGQYRMGRMDGHGRMEWRAESGTQVYVGQYKDDRKHGEGKFSWPDGRAYDGAWKSGLRNGTGIFISSQGQRRRGQWENDSLVKWFSAGEEAGDNNVEGGAKLI